ncbi:MAG: hypothetical protein KME35_13945 [Aphanocapsa sp. GSE-SYN-MK-11-07L]|nr:hypothetical protein [Aphanocapsa sp. GSE-SYN-MK-11-07L]
MQTQVPEAIQSFSQSVYFPYALEIINVIRQTPAFQHALAYLSAFEEPEPDKIEYVAKTLIGTWITNGASKISVRELLDKARQISPCYVRSFAQDWQLDPEVSEILNNIENLTYNLAKGFFHWEYLSGLQRGTPPYSIDSDDFRRLQERIKRQKPTSFEELENLL